MDKRIVTFVTLSALFIIAAYWAAYTLDTFATGLVALIPICYFIAAGIHSLLQLIKRREGRINWVIGFGSVIAFVVLLNAFSVSDHGLGDLTKRRTETLNELRPLLLKYKGERGGFPRNLQDLVPDYLRTVPPELLHDGKEDSYKKIRYEVISGEARFTFQRARGPDSRVIYHVSENRYEYDR
jgi:hypothetical protein